MKPKQAIVYNVVSSVLAFCGMLVGVLIGNIESASLWIFTVVGGMFLYVALVDMVITELSQIMVLSGFFILFRSLHILCLIVTWLSGRLPFQQS